ncbi:hypothetical protein RFI_22507 [Reticulomyxa filosa]|uniref:EF-hand domain-containing protein n=1 Tax=Reticulomyxa filosa TaxID=46433 RepID=X6MN83_RETFI|nr:hypothetical protein RFI_22507 [Reticulomyxa filosa]|eukprot:ETO14862.1 hypothetical protein RFI_22507 [Reticulomyxa filosa]
MLQFIAFLGAILSTKNKIYITSLLFHLCDFNNDHIVRKEPLKQFVSWLCDTYGRKSKSNKNGNKNIDMKSLPSVEIQELLRILFSSHKKQLSFEEFSTSLMASDFLVVQKLVVWFLRYGLSFSDKTISKLTEQHQFFPLKN